MPHGNRCGFQLAEPKHTRGIGRARAPELACLAKPACHPWPEACLAVSEHACFACVYVMAQIPDCCLAGGAAGEGLGRGGRRGRQAAQEQGASGQGGRGRQPVRRAPGLTRSCASGTCGSARRGSCCMPSWVQHATQAAASHIMFICVPVCKICPLTITCSALDKTICAGGLLHVPAPALCAEVVGSALFCCSASPGEMKCAPGDALGVGAQGARPVQEERAERCGQGAGAAHGARRCGQRGRH